jgi:hypothetical protein
MASTKQRADKQKEKEKKEKILLVVLVLILVVVGAVMLPGMLKKKANPAATVPATTQTTSTSSSPIDAGTSSGVSASGPSGAATFPDVDTTYQPGDGQLSAFGHFAINDPFGNAPNAGNGNAASTSASTSPSTTTPSGGSFAAAVISINGASSTVTLHSTFPAASQAFILDSIAAGSITVSVTNGSFTGGRSLVTIQKGHTVVLENTVDGTRYALKMIATASSGATSGGTTVSASTSSETTTSASTSTAATTSTEP